MPKRSAGILLYRRRGRGGVEVLLVHPGGPFWAKKDDGAWSIPKGIYQPDAEGGLTAAKREFAEETGAQATGEAIALGATASNLGSAASSSSNGPVRDI